jgi:hypothetical protein
VVHSLWVNVPISYLKKHRNHMLHLLFTRTKIVAGYQTGSTPQLLLFDEEPFLRYPDQSPLKGVDHYFPALVSAYREAADHSGGQPIPLSIALPTDISSADRAMVRQQFLQTKSPAFELIHEDNLAVSFLMGMVASQRIEDQHVAVLEALEHHTNVCFFRPGPSHSEAELIKLNTPFSGEFFESHLLKDFGPVAGNGQVLSDLLKSFTQAGLKVDFKGQTDLAHQLEQVTSPFRFQINQETERVTLAGEVRLSDDEYEQLMTSNRDRLQPFLNENVLKQQKTAHVLLLGDYLHQPSVLNYLKKDLKVGNRLVEDVPEGDAALFDIMLMGLASRSAQVQELIRLRKAEEARRAKLEAEIKVKENREKLLERLQATCINPAKQEEYESEFVPLAVELGIPEVVIKWNISEALSRVSLDEEAAKAGIKAEAPVPEPKAKSNGSSPSQPARSERKATPEPERSSNPKSESKPVAAPQPVVASNGAKGSPVAVAEPKVNTAVKTAPEMEVETDSSSRKKPALNAIFTLNDNLTGEEFPSRKATFKGDSTIKLVRLLPEEKQADSQAVKRFEALYEKEKTYYGPLGEISEVSEAKEGRYYFRDFIERNTLKEYITRVGLDKKQKVEDLSSDDLKFILQVFKSVQELTVTHAQIDETNILVLNKRRGLLRRGGQAEIRFTGFTSQSSTQEQMTQATHQAFARLMGTKFYTDFRKQFQL